MKRVLFLILFFISLSLSGQRIGIIASSVSTASAYGAELTTNGGFDTGTGWEMEDAGATVTGGQCVINSANLYTLMVSQSITLEVGSTYKIEFDIQNYVIGKLRFKLGHISDSYGASNDIDYTGDQHVSVELTYAIQSEFDNIEFYTWDAVLNVRIDNVSVKEVL